MTGPDRKSRLGSFIAGLGALVSLYPPPSAAPRYPHASDMDALRGDAVRVGDDMRRVIEREKARGTASGA